MCLRVLACNGYVLEHQYTDNSTSGYTLDSLKETESGLTAQLNLAGDACNAFGNDIANLTIQVTYETETR